MEKNHSQYKQQGLLKNEVPKPYIRRDKETDKWTMCAYTETSIQEETTIEIIMDRKQLDTIARLIAYLYHDRKDDYIDVATDQPKEHIYQDLRSIDQWLTEKYNQLERANEQSE